MKKGIIGGTFDPFHNGHLYIAEQAIKLLNLDRIVFIPAGNPPHKKYKNVTDSKIRYKMLCHALKDEKCFEIDNFEILKKGLSYTYETLLYLKKKEPNTEWYFICGLDCLMELETWKNVNVIFSLCKLVVFAREGYDEIQVKKQKEAEEKKYGKKIHLINLPKLNISSSYIRECIESGEDISNIVPEAVNKDIINLKLYK
ncbi:MAG: nicotinate-nucleotide adenylyltransferase [Clostridium sp.]|nr:nicotinate-nucleotide adenylyltransferase [Clostridium sp.]